MNPYDDNLVPIMKKCDLDAAAEKMLAKYYPEALAQPMRVRAVVLAKRMGFKVQNARLSEDDSKLGSIYFDDTEVTFFVNGEIMTGTAKSGTILIDVQAHKNRNIMTDETIIHECIHAYLHRVFYFVQSSYHAFLSEALESIDDIEVDNSSSGVLKWIENQAVHMVFRVRMPLKHTSLMAAKLFMKYRDISDKEALENVIRELSDFFGVSRTAASVRLTEIGYDIERGVGQYANGMPVPGYIVGKEIHNDKTYTIDFRDIVEEYQRNEDFRKVIDNGGYVYAEGHLCRNKPEYIDNLPTGISLTPYARTHMSECCLLFKNLKVKKKEKFDYRKLDRVIETNEITNLYQHDGKDIITEASDAAKIMTHLPNSFAETLIFHMKNLGISIRQLADVSCVSARTITRMRTINAPSPTLESIVAVSIGMKLFPELSFDMVKKAEKEFDYTNPVHFWYMVVLRTMYCDGIIRCNDMLRKNGIPPLGTK